MNKIVLLLLLCLLTNLVSKEVYKLAFEDKEVIKLTNDLKIKFDNNESSIYNLNNSTLYKSEGLFVGIKMGYIDFAIVKKDELQKRLQDKNDLISSAKFSGFEIITNFVVDKHEYILITNTNSYKKYNKSDIEKIINLLK